MVHCVHLVTFVYVWFVHVKTRYVVQIQGIPWRLR